ncbi:MAG TPA: DUF559 domain-containing protein [Solirubrobacterales bacterium]|nr:DUF559 domain-containing protein [Solirubrobacterales bacterium]
MLADLDAGAGVPDGELEVRFARFIADHGLQEPLHNLGIDLGDRAVIVDCAWPRRRLVVELDGHAVHARRIQIDSDKERDRALMLAGWRVIRVTWRHLHEGREKLAADLRHLLG